MNLFENQSNKIYDFIRNNYIFYSMKKIQLRDEIEYMLIQYVLETSKDKSINHILNRLIALKKMNME